MCRAQAHVGAPGLTTWVPSRRPTLQMFLLACHPDFPPLESWAAGADAAARQQALEDLEPFQRMLAAGLLPLMLTPPDEPSAASGAAAMAVLPLLHKTLRNFKFVEFAIGVTGERPAVRSNACPWHGMHGSAGAWTKGPLLGSSLVVGCLGRRRMTACCPCACTER